MDWKMVGDFALALIIISVVIICIYGALRKETVERLAEVKSRDLEAYLRAYVRLKEIELEMAKLADKNRQARSDLSEAD